MLLIFHHPYTSGAQDWLQYIVSTVSNVHIVEASKFSEKLLRHCQANHFALVLTTMEKARAEIPGMELAKARCLIYDRWRDIAKALYHNRMAWRPEDMMLWISFMKSNFEPCPTDDLGSRVDTIYRKNWNHMVKMFPQVCVAKRIKSWFKAWHLDPKDPTWDTVDIRLRRDKRPFFTHVLPINTTRSNRRVERLLCA